MSKPVLALQPGPCRPGHISWRLLKGNQNPSWTRALRLLPWRVFAQHVQKPTCSACSPALSIAKSHVGCCATSLNVEDSLNSKSNYANQSFDTRQSLEPNCNSVSLRVEAHQAFIEQFRFQLTKLLLHKCRQSAVAVGRVNTARNTLGHLVCLNRWFAVMILELHWIADVSPLMLAPRELFCCNGIAGHWLVSGAKQSSHCGSWWNKKKRWEKVATNFLKKKSFKLFADGLWMLLALKQLGIQFQKSWMLRARGTHSNVFTCESSHVKRI